MTENTNFSPHPTPLEMPVGLKANDPVRSKRTEGRVPHILADQQALHQWQRNVEKLRQKEASQ